MADDVDQCSVNETLILEANIRQVTAAAALIPQGFPGECYYCGEESERLVGKPGACARCRDKRRLP